MFYIKLHLFNNKNKLLQYTIIHNLVYGDQAFKITDNYLFNRLVYTIFLFDIFN